MSGEMTLDDMLIDDLGLEAEIERIRAGMRKTNGLPTSKSDDELTHALLDVLLVDIHKGSESSGYYGPRPGTGRPGQIGGSTSTSQQVADGDVSHEDMKRLVELLKDPKNVLQMQQITGEEADGSTIFVADIRGYGSIIIKPENAQRGSYLREVCLPGRSNNKEFAARIINEALGEPVRMQHIALHDFGSKVGPDGNPMGRALVYGYVHGLSLAGMETSGQSLGRGLGLIQEHPDFERMGLLDGTIGNLDRHHRNILVDEFDNLVANDHEESFPSRNANTSGVPVVGAAITTLDRQPKLRPGEMHRLDILQHNRDAVTTRLQTYLKPSEINAMWERVDTMRSTRKIYVIGGEHRGQGYYHTEGGRLSSPRAAVKADIDEIAYYDIDGVEIGTTWVHNGVAVSAGVGVGDDQMLVTQPGKPNTILTPADGAAWIKGLQATCRTEHCSGRLRMHGSAPVTLRDEVLQAVQKGGPRSGFHGHKGRPGERGGSVAVGITSYRPDTPRTPGEVVSDADSLIQDLKRDGAEVLDVAATHGVWLDEQGTLASEPALRITIRGTDKQVLPALARAGARWNQDAVLVMRGAAESDAAAQRNWRFDFGSALTAETTAHLSDAARKSGLWSWALDSNSGSLHVQAVPEYQSSQRTAAAVHKLIGLLDKASIPAKLTKGRAHVTLIHRGDYARFLKAQQAESGRLDTGRPGQSEAYGGRSRDGGFGFRRDNGDVHTEDATEVAKGGPGSGFHDHAGRPGEVGGSQPGEGNATGQGTGTGPETEAGRLRRELAEREAAEGALTVPTEPVPLDQLNDPQSENTLRSIYGRLGTVEPGKDTLNELKIYDLKSLIEKPEGTQRMLDDLGFKVETFSFVNDPEAGVKFRVPDLKRKGYDSGTLWIYDPRVAHGSFEDTEYTRTWRTFHEAGHAVTEPLLQEKYGASKREGRLGIEGEGVRGDPAKRTVAVPLKPLTLMHAQRAVEWEDTAFRTQRILLKDYGGVNISDTDFAREHNVNIADATFRVLTGDFGDPGKYGFRPSTQRASTRDLLTWLENQEASIAKSQGRAPTKGIDLKTWKPVSDAQIRAHISAHIVKKKSHTGHHGRLGQRGGSLLGSNAPANPGQPPQPRGSKPARVRTRPYIRRGRIYRAFDALTEALLDVLTLDDTASCEPCTPVHGHKEESQLDVRKGGQGSGHHGHHGRPGHRGGSLPEHEAAASPPPAVPTPIVAPEVDTSLQQARAILDEKMKQAKRLFGDVTDEQAAEYEAEFKRVLDNMPEPMVKRIAANLRGIVWAADGDSVDTELRIRNPSVPPWVTALGFSDPKFADVVFNGGGSGATGSWKTAEVYAHELAHAFDIPYTPTATGRVKAIFSDTQDWQSVWEKEITRPGTSPYGTSPFGELEPAPGLSKYAASSGREGFAEYVRLLTFDRKTAETQFPKSWAFFKKNGLV